MILRRLLVLILCLCVLGTSVAWSADDGSMSVQVKQSQVRTAPSFLARIIATLNYGDRVYIVSRQGTWSQIFLPSAGVKGWVHSSALTTKKIVLKAGRPMSTRPPPATNSHWPARASIKKSRVNIEIITRT